MQTMNKIKGTPAKSLARAADVPRNTKDESLPHAVKLSGGRQGIKLSENETLTWERENDKIIWFSNGDRQDSLFEAVELTFPSLHVEDIKVIVIRCEQIKGDIEDPMTMPGGYTPFEKVEGGRLNETS